MGEIKYPTRAKRGVRDSNNTNTDLRPKIIDTGEVVNQISASNFTKATSK